MINSEYIKSMNCNFERIRLSESPEEKRYQYCIVNRGGIKGLLPCSLRVINGDAYLYYDITSKQGLNQIFRKKKIGRQWVKEFTWNLKRISQELNRFLLDSTNIIWYPENIYQDLEDNRWSYLYYPYFEGDNGFSNLLEFIIEKLDYEDETLVECVYKIYEQYEAYGDVYLSEKIYQDVLMLDKPQEDDVAEDNSSIMIDEGDSEIVNSADSKFEDSDFDEDNIVIEETRKNQLGSSEDKAFTNPTKDKRGLLSFLDGSRRRDKELREKKRKNNHYILDGGLDNEGVAEESEFYDCKKDDGGSGKTIYIENIAEDKDSRRRIYDIDGKVLRLLEQDSLIIGKKRDEADMIIDNSSISRIHARIYYADGEYILEDLNSTNGTFKNGLRLKPYEKRKLIVGDEIKLGNVALMYS